MRSSADGDGEDESEPAATSRTVAVPGSTNHGSDSHTVPCEVVESLKPIAPERLKVRFFAKTSIKCEHVDESLEMIEDE
jgi:hypothetical protein